MWRVALPVLRTRTAVLREVANRDTAALTVAMSRPEVRRYLPLGPTTEEQFSRFIRWVRRERRAGRYVCFTVVPHGCKTAAGLFQLWPVEPGFGVAEMGFALDQALWGTDTFIDCATAIVDFAVDVLAVRRLECRSAVTNTRGTAALQKLGAVQEGTLRRCFQCPEGLLDHTIWSILVDDWRHRRVDGRRCA
jgi:RimJ/RimL family protein N-acetyltransferase